MTKVLVVSDSHGQNKILEEVIMIEQPDLIVHAGDHTTSKKYMDEICDFYVAGNNDYIGESEEIFKIEDVTVFLVHGHRHVSWTKKNWHQNLYDDASNYEANLIIYGHSHVEIIDKIKGVTIINPGSIAYPRNSSLTKTYIVLWIDKNKINNIEIKYLK